MTSIDDLPVTTLDGRATTFGALRDGRAALVVNVASRCGLTPQYAALEEVHEKYVDQGFSVLGFPCNQFMGQEPGTNEEIAEFCSTTYGVTFPLTAKVDVNGPDRDPIYRELVGDGEDIQWNFEKFLVGRDGTVVERFAPTVVPDAPEVIAAIERTLDAKT